MQRCEYYHCDKVADGFAMVPATWKMPLHLGKKFFCRKCWDTFLTAWNDPATWKGLVAPANAPGDWRPSLADHLRHAEIAMAFETRHKDVFPPVEDWLIKLRGWTPAQVRQVEFLRRMNREIRN